jgi:hypothetical protein
MYFFIFIFILLILIIATAALIPFTAFFELNTETNTFQLSINWMQPFLKANLTMKDLKPVLTVYVFDKRFFTHILKKGKKKNSKKYLQSINLEDSYIKAYYGMQTPFSVGLTYGILNVCLSYMDFDIVENYPDFISATEYLIIEAGAKVSILKTVSNYWGLSNKTKRRKRYGYV